MKRLLAALLLVASPALSQSNGWREIANGWGEIQTALGSYASMSAPATCTTAGQIPVFLGSPLALGCDAGLTFDPESGVTLQGHVNIHATSGQTADTTAWVGSTGVTVGGVTPTGGFHTLDSLKAQTIAYGQNLIPTMTSLTAPSGVVTCDRQCDWYAFDGNDATFFNQMSPPYAGPSWIAYQFATATAVDSYSFRNDQSIYLPRDWVFQGSQDGATWTNLDTRVAVTGLQPDTVYTYSFTNSTAFARYRLYVTKTQENNVNSVALKIGTLAFYSTAGQTVTTVTADATGVTSTALKLTAIPTYASNAAAASLATGTVYRTSTGVLMIKY